MTAVIFSVRAQQMMHPWHGMKARNRPFKPCGMSGTHYLQGWVTPVADLQVQKVCHFSWLFLAVITVVLVCVSLPHCSKLDILLQ